MDTFSQGEILISKETKLQPRENDLCQVREKINNNAYKIDLPGEFLVHSTFNVADLSPFDLGDDFPDSRTNPFEEGEHDKDHGITNVLTRPITQFKAKKI